MITDKDIQEAALSYSVCYGTGNEITAFADGAKWALEEEKRRANQALREALKGQTGYLIHKGKPEGDTLLSLD